jgi:cell division protein FtsN
MTPPPSSGKAKTQKKKTNTGNGFPAWVILVLVLAAALGVGFYFLYPKVSPYVDSAIASIKGEKKPTEKQPDRDLPTTETEVPDAEVAQTLDSSTDKKTALNPAGESSSQQAKPAQTSTPSQAKPTTTTQPVKTQPATSGYSQGGVGSGKYLLIAGSFTTRSRAEAFGQQSLQPAGINYEIIDFGNERVRVAVASFDSQTKAYNQANIFKSKPHCKNVWVLRR